VCDAFAVQWPALADKLNRNASKGRRVLYMGPWPRAERAAAGGPMNPTLPSHRPPSWVPGDAGDKAGLCVVTVGSTRFDELVLAALDPAFIRLLGSTLGVRRLLVQCGRTDALPRMEALARAAAPLMDEVEVREYVPGMGALIARQAALVVSHAGAGTILECLAARVPTIVVPNARLMNNHQLELAERLADRGHLVCCAVPERLVEVASGAEWHKLVPLVHESAPVFRDHILPHLQSTAAK
jgi:UDP-N-acetylglucosamine transferase subunit ALG13